MGYQIINRSLPQFSWQLHRAFSRRIYIRDLISTQLGGIPTRLRLEQLLWQLLYAQNYDVAIANSKWQQGKKKLFLPLQRQELAQMLSVSPEYLSRLLGKMEKEGIIRREMGWLIVTDPERLWRAPDIQALTGVDSTQRAVADLPNLIMARSRSRTNKVGQTIVAGILIGCGVLGIIWGNIDIHRVQ